jgi:3-hydroxyisobutyrate dehydrogenase-like beta-hydroxyacid dehydrogenase
MSMRVGFLGLGIMGRAMSRNILQAGHQVAVYNRTPRDVPGLESALRPKDPAGVAKYSDVIVVMVTGPEAVDELLFGENGAAEAAAGKTIVNMSTVDPAYAESLARKLEVMGVGYLDAPVSGSKKPAEEGNLVVLAGGPSRLVKELEPLLLCMARKVAHCGEAGAGSMMKMANNLLLGVMVEGLAEMLAFAEQGGLDAELVLKVVQNGPMANDLYEMKAPLLLSREYWPQFPLKHMAKDLRFAVRTAGETGARLEAGKTVAALFEQAESQGAGEEDFSAVARLLR